MVKNKRFAKIAAVTVMLSGLTGFSSGNDIETLNKLQFANGLFRDGMYEMARKQFLEIAGSSYPGIVEEAAFMQAECLFRVKNFPLAYKEFEKTFSSFSREVKERSLSRMGDCAYHMKRYGDAADIYAKFIKLYGENEDALFYLAQSLSELKKYDESGKYYRKLLEKYPKSVFREYAMYSAGYAYFKTGNYAKAAGLFAGVSDKKIKAESLFYEGLSFIHSSDMSSALKRFDNIATGFKDSPWAAKANLKKAEILIKDKKFDEAEKILEPLRASGAGAAEALYLTGQAFYAKKSFAQAAVYYRSCADNHSGSEWAEKSLFSLGWSYTHLQDYLRGRKAFAELILKHSKTAYFPKAQFLIGHCYFFERDYGAASDAYARLLSAFPGDELAGDAHYWQGASLLKASRFSEAASVFREVIKRGEASGFLSRAYLGLGKSLALAGDHSAAAIELEKGLSVKGTDLEKDELAFELGNACVKLGRFPEAVRYYGKVSAPSLIADALAASGHAYLNWKKFDEARESYRETVDSYPDSPAAEDAAFSVGVSFYKEKNWASARSHLMDFAAKYPASTRIADAYLYAGWSAFSLKDWTASIKFWKRHYEIQPSEDVLLRIGDAYYNAGQGAEARACYAELLDKFPSSPKIPQALYSMALVDRKEGRLEGAAELILRIDRKYQSSEIAPDALFTLGEIYEERNDYVSSGEIYGRIYSGYPKSPLAVDSLYRAARSAARAENYALARQFYGELAEKKSAYLEEARFRICEAFFNEKNYASAADEALKFRDDFSSSAFAPGALEIARKALTEQGLSARASGLKDILTRDYPASGPSARIYFDEGKKLYESGNHKEAAEALRKVTANLHDIDSARAQILIASAFFSMKQYDEAWLEYSKAVYVYPEFPDIVAEGYYGIGSVRIKQGKKSEAEKAFGRILENWPDSPLAAKASEELEKLK
ncbi:MAG: tetratricopeptide repeat protein [Elusimicrobiota bacterium]|nr:tetratricopeptide repeat protein [Elusimicrobiota bacterium]